MFEDSEKSKNVASALQSYAIIASLVIGGIWAAFEFSKLHRAEISKADMQIKRIQADIKSVINIELIPSVIVINSEKHLKVVARLKNSGNKDGYLRFAERPIIYATRIEAIENGAPKYGSTQKSFIFMPTAGGGLGALPDAVIRSGEITEYPFILQVREPGVYMIRFIVKVEEEDERLPNENKNYSGEWSHQIVHVLE